MDSLTGVANGDVRSTPQSRQSLGQALRSANDPKRKLIAPKLSYTGFFTLLNWLLCSWFTQLSLMEKSTAFSTIVILNSLVCLNNISEYHSSESVSHVSLYIAETEPIVFSPSTLSNVSPFVLHSLFIVSYKIVSQCGNFSYTCICLLGRCDRQIMLVSN